MLLLWPPCVADAHIIFFPVVSSFFLWLPYGIGQTIVFSCCGFYLLSIFFPLDFSKMAAVRHLGFVVCVRTTHEGRLIVFIAVQKLVGIDAVVLIISMFFDFTNLA